MKRYSWILALVILVSACALRRPPSVVELAVSVQVTLGQLQDKERAICNVLDASTGRPVTVCTELAHQQGLTTALHKEISLEFAAAFKAQRELALSLSKGDPLASLVALGRSVLRLEGILVKIPRSKETQALFTLLATLNERMNSLGKGVSS